METTPISSQPDLPLSGSPAEKLHDTLLLAHATGNLARWKFISSLLDLHESKLYFQLGSPSIEHYARTHFGIERSITFEYLRVARELRGLPRSEEEFRSGRLNWSALREITKVATSETEEEWIDFALKPPGKKLKAEVKEAQRKNRSTPRKNGYSLPSLETRLVFELKPEEQDIASKALEEAAREMGEKLEGAQVEPKDALLFLARRYLEDRLNEEESSGNLESPEKSLYTILYHTCPECRRSSLPTPEGPVEIASEVVERVEGDAQKVVIEESEVRPQVEDEGPPEIDRPNPPSLVRKVYLRDARTCSNPGCDCGQGLHVHHIVERAQRGATAVYNEVLVCTTCHALLHAGNLKVEGNPYERLEWTVAAGERSDDFWARMKELNAVPERQLLSQPSSPQSTAVDSENAAPEGQFSRPLSSQSTAVDLRVGWSERLEVVLKALRSLGFSVREGKRRLEAAVEKLGAKVTQASEEEILKIALRSSVA